LAAPPVVGMHVDVAVAAIRRGQHRRQVRPAAAVAGSGAVIVPLQRLDAAMGATPGPVGRRVRNPAAPPGSTMTTQHGHSRLRRRRRPAWRPPGRRGSQDLNQDRENARERERERERERQTEVSNYRASRPIPRRNARPHQQMPLRRHLPTAPGQRSRSRLCATRWLPATIVVLLLGRPRAEREVVPVP
jgi:hypothetical protein